MICTNVRLRTLPLVLLLGTMLSTAAPLAAQARPVAAAKAIVHPPLGPIPAAAQFDANGHLDPDAATRAYLDTVPADKRAASNKYFEGQYWLTLWDALFGIAMLLALLQTGLSAKIRDLAAKWTSKTWLQPGIYFALFTILTTLIQAPLTWYEGFYRELIYQQSHQAIGGWLHDQAIGLLVGSVLGGVLVLILYIIVRRLPKTWHLWGTGVVWVFFAFISMLAPIYIAPLFNTYSRIEDTAVTLPLLKMAHSNGIPVNDLYQVDASKQTTRVSANVSGLFKTTRITLNDNLLSLCSLEEIESITGHEMGHYVLNHIAHRLVESLIVIFLVFTVLRAWLESLQRRRGARWGSTSIFDPAMLPGILMIQTIIFLLLTPVTNTMTRTQEIEADMYGLNTARQPDGFSQAAIKLGQYRKMEPTPVEEIIFFDHPSGRNRILASMRWKSVNQTTPGYK